jgi:hypothetical protein
MHAVDAQESLMPFGLRHLRLPVVASIIGQDGMAKALVHLAAAKTAESVAAIA